MAKTRTNTIKTVGVTLKGLEQILEVLRNEGEVHVILEEGETVPSLAEMILEKISQFDGPSRQQAIPQAIPAGYPYQSPFNTSTTIKLSNLCAGCGWGLFDGRCINSSCFMYVKL